MQSISQIANRLIADESGQDLIEYALIAALIGLAAVATLRTLATSVTGIFNSIVTTLNAATPAP